MDAHTFDPVEFKKHLRGYWVVFGALCVGTVLTVAAATFGLHRGWSEATVITVALIIASTKATLVALYFMHLIDEKKLIYWTLLLVATLFLPLLFLPNLTVNETSAHRDPSKMKPMPGIHEPHEGGDAGEKKE
jgi:cytochrome c oxidase subunit 4